MENEKNAEFLEDEEMKKKMKKPSPITTMTAQILDEIQEHNALVRGHREHFVSLLQHVEWNLIESGTFNNPHSGQALGLVRGALKMFGKDPQKDPQS